MLSPEVAGSTEFGTDTVASKARLFLSQQKISLQVHLHVTLNHSLFIVQIQSNCVISNYMGLFKKLRDIQVFKISRLKYLKK